jgi:hypothetical protein
VPSHDPVSGYSARGLSVQGLQPILQALLDCVIGGCADARGEFLVLYAQLVLDLGLSLATNSDPVTAAVWLPADCDALGLAATGFYPLGGARYLRDARPAGPLLCRLVAPHSCAIIEAEERGLAGVLDRESGPPRDALGSALTFCDMTTSPDGGLVPAGGWPKPITGTAPGTW